MISYIVLIAAMAFGFFIGYLVRGEPGDSLWQRSKNYFDLYSRHRNKP